MNNKKDEMLRWLKNAILEYLKTRNNSKTNSLDIIVHFKLSADVTFTALMEMEKDGEVKRINFFAEGWNGNHTYVLPNRIESEAGYIIKSGRHSLAHPLSDKLSWWRHYRNTECFVHPEDTLNKLTSEFTKDWKLKPTHAIPAKYEDGKVIITGKPFKL